MEVLSDILHRHGALVLFGVVFAEQLGLPLPALPLLAAAGVLIGTGHIGLLPAVSAAFAATLLADGLWYLAGQRRGPSVLAVLCKIALEPDTCVRRTEAVFQKHGPHSLVWAKFIPGLSTIAPPLAGIVGLGPVIFLIYDAIGTALWVGSGLGMGYAFGAGVPQMAASVTQITPLVGAVIAVLLTIYIVGKAWQRRRTWRRAPRIAVTEVLDRLEGGEPVRFIDVRSAAERREVPGIEGAWAMTLEELREHAAALTEERIVVLYCACPEDAASAQATVMLRRWGADRVWALQGGLAAWQARDRATPRWKPAAMELPVLPSS